MYRNVVTEMSCVWNGQTEKSCSSNDTCWIDHTQLTAGWYMWHHSLCLSEIHIFKQEFMPIDSDAINVSANYR